MGVNMAAAGIINDAVVREAGKQEIIRRYFQYRLEYAEGIGKLETVERVERLMKKAGVGVSDGKLCFRRGKRQNPRNSPERQ